MHKIKSVISLLTLFISTSKAFCFGGFLAPGNLNPASPVSIFSLTSDEEKKNDKEINKAIIELFTITELLKFNFKRLSSIRQYTQEPNLDGIREHLSQEINCSLKEVKVGDFFHYDTKGK